MQLSDLLVLAVQHGVNRRTQKRAGVMLPLAVGAMIPTIVQKAIDRAHSTEQSLDRASMPKMGAFPHGGGGGGGPPAGGGAPNPMTTLAPSSLLTRGQAYGRMGGKALGGEVGGGFLGSLGEIAGAPGGGIAGGLSKLVERKLFGQQLGERHDALGIGGAAAAKGFGAEIGKAGVGLLADIANKAMEAAGHAGDASAREAIIGDLKRNDSVLAGANDATLMEAYHTMTRFAPVLSTDKNAVRSFLRQAVMSGSGPDFMSIKLLADSERAVTGGDHKRAAAMPGGLAELLPSLERGVLAGAGTGAISGAMADKEDRGGGALRGALTGGALGGLGGALHGRAARAPVASPGVSNELQTLLFNSHPGGFSTPAASVGPEGMARVTQTPKFGNPQGAATRWIPQGAQEAWRDLNQRGVLS